MATHSASITYTTLGSAGILLDPTSLTAVSTYTTIGDGNLAVTASIGEFRILLVHNDGTPEALLENANFQGIDFKLNQWESWSFTLLTTDVKAGLLQERNFREVQLWWGDLLLAWGPITRTRVANSVITANVVGAAWILSRRHVGKAARTNMLANPSFEQGFGGWEYLRVAFPFTFETPSYGQLAMYGPGRDNVGQALEINSEWVPYTPPGGSIGSGTAASHTVTSGQTLWGLAETYYGSGIHWRRIYDANASLIQSGAVAAGLWNPRDPGHWIFPGQVLTIPKIAAAEPQAPPADNGLRWGGVLAFQEFLVSGGIRGATFTLTGWCKVPSAQFGDWGSDTGITLQRLPSNYRTSNRFVTQGLPNTWGGRRALYSDNIEWKTSQMSAGHPMDGWIRHEVSITVPAGSTEALVARILGISGRIYWDMLTLTQDTAFERFSTDQATIVAGLVTHAQDPAFEKNSINLGTDARATGVLRDLVALHEEHANIWDLISEVTKFERGIDISTQYTPTTRTLVTHFPFQGATRTGLHLMLGRNIALYDWAFDGEAASSVTVVLGTGSGSDREEASYINTTAFDDGLVLETVTAVGPETPVDRLQELANEYGEVNTRPITLTVQTYPHSDDSPERKFLGRLSVGDMIPVTIQDGPIYDATTGELLGHNFYVADVFRIVGMRVNEDTTLSLELNRRDFGNA